MITIDVFEHGVLRIDEHTFKKVHWDACVKFNAAHDNAYFDVLHNGLRFKQFVGAIQIDQCLIHIHPKADKSDHDDKWRDVLLKMLEACGKVKAQTVGAAQLKKQPLNLLEVYFEYYLTEIESLIRCGLVKKYRKETGNVKALKGKLDFAGNIRHNLVHQERFYTTHQVYDLDHRLHQVLKHALDIVKQFTRGTYLSDKCGRVCLAFPEVNPIKLNASILESIQLDRKTKPYKRALELAKLIILNYSPDINHGQQNMISLLFDMNQLWEEYVLVQLKKHLSDKPEWHISGQESKSFHGSWRTLRPDIVIKNGEVTYIIDTKWKRPTSNSASIEDLRQMYAYGRFWNSEHLILLYPGEQSSDDYIEYRNHEFDPKNHKCKVAFVSVLEKSLLNTTIGNNIMDLIK